MLALDEVISVYGDARDHIAETIHATHEVTLPPPFGLVLVKTLGYCFNTFKAIGLLLPELYYEHGCALFRILWEAAVNLAWISAAPADRSILYAQFTVVERRRLIQLRFVEAVRGGDRERAAGHEAELREFDVAFQRVLADYWYEDKRRRKRLRQRFSGPGLEDIVRELGDPWLTEYRQRYPLLSFYTHASPGAVLFPNPFLKEVTKEAFEGYDLPRTIQVALWSIAIMERVHKVACAAFSKDDAAYFERLEERLCFRGSLKRPA
jgi:hypothetical protein